MAGRYRILKPLGIGGMGTVYLAQDSVLNEETVAIKILHGDYVRDQKHTQRFLREVQLMRRVNHANVVRTFDVGSDDDIVYFTMEFVPGRPLDEIIEQRDLQRNQLPKLICNICSGLQAIHEAGIIHRDLKPGNILVTNDYGAKIADFGVARPEASDLTAHNEIIGSSSYMAPEVWLGNQLTASVDLYSLGIILYEICTGDRPYKGDSAAILMRLHLDRDPVPPKSLNPSIPLWLNKLVLKLLAKSPLDRPKTAQEIVDYVNLQADRSVFLEAEDAMVPDSPAGEAVSQTFIATLEEISKKATQTELPAVLGGQPKKRERKPTLFQRLLGK